MSSTPTPHLDGLPTAEEMHALRAGKPIAKGPTRLEVKAVKDKADDKAERVFKAAVWKRDEGKCRVCGVKVLRSLELQPKRGEVHHIAGRADRAVRHDSRNGLLVCALDHERLEHFTLVIIATGKQMFKAKNGQTYINADCPLKFQGRR